LLRDLRAAAREPGASLGRLIVVESPSGDPEAGRSFDLDAITTLGRDVNNAIVVEDPFASADHAVLTYRGRSWYVEDLGSTNGTYVNGRAIASVAPLGFGDELSIGQVRLRLERARSA
jgi:pSer/pThr/pTyr-binding forkhead associated (FHA) protein